MDDQDDRSLRNRVAALEETVRKLRRSSEQLSSQLSYLESMARAGEHQPVEPPRTFIQNKVEPVPPTVPKPKPVPPEPKKPPKKSFELPENMRKSEYWLNKIGIGLILFAVVFLFKYSVDQGWLTPPIRIIFGLLLGCILLFLGFRIYPRKKHFSQVLTGGAIATYYITGFAAFQMFSLVSYPVALAFMIAVTVLAFFVSLRQDEAVFSLIGTLGGLGTPFLLYTEAGSIAGLMIYTCFILGGTSAIYFYQGWRSLLWLSIIGGWPIILIGLINASDPSTTTIADHWALQLAIIVGWLLFWAVPVLRETAGVSNPGRWRRSTIGIGNGSLSETTRGIIDHHVFLLPVFVPIIALMFSMINWQNLSQSTWGWIVMGGAVIFGAAWMYLKRFDELKNLAFTHAIVGLSSLTLSLFMLLEGDTLLLALALEAAVLHLVAIRISSKGISIFAHILWGVCALWLAGRLHITEISRLMEPIEGMSILNARALTDLCVLGLGVLLSTRLKFVFEKRFYFIAALVFLAFWLCRELEGNIRFMAVMAEAVLLHRIARWKDDRTIAVTGHAIFGALGIWLAVRLLSPHSDVTAILNGHALINLFAIFVFLAICKWLTVAKEIFPYRLFAHIAFLAWFISEFSPLEDGQGYITIAWGIYSALLLVAALRFNYRRLRTVAMATLFLVVAKLFLIDLANLEVLWRILLFMGFGGLFLFLSYYFQDLWKAKAKAADDSEG
jgi:hypothetical protein